MEDEIDLRSLPFSYPSTFWHSFLELSVPPFHNNLWPPNHSPLDQCIFPLKDLISFGQKDLANNVNSDTRNKREKNRIVEWKEFWRQPSLILALLCGLGKDNIFL